MPSERDLGRAVVNRLGDVVVKAHAVGTSEHDLEARLRFAARGAPFVAPLGATPVRIGERLVSRWPAGKPVDSDHLDAAPWREAGLLLAALHGSTAEDLPPCGAPARLEGTMARLGAGADADLVRAALATARPFLAGGPRTVVHGDWHLGQLAAFDGQWRLLDVDDLGIGHPAWDLARTAAFQAARLLPPGAWDCFLEAYREGGGPAVPPGGDPWPALDAHARALVAQLAASALIHEREERALWLDACSRVARTPLVR